MIPPFLSDTPLSLPCRHVFCADCVHPWVGSKKSCPECRAETKLSEFTKVAYGYPEVLELLREHVEGLGLDEEEL